MGAPNETGSVLPRQDKPVFESLAPIFSTSLFPREFWLWLLGYLGKTTHSQEGRFWGDKVAVTAPPLVSNAGGDKYAPQSRRPSPRSFHEGRSA